jgi:NodT family efflux transporter outer membrane factor (OMF) lipoprotein
VTDKSTGASVSISYELDLWGRLAAGVRAGEANLAATRFDLDALRLSLAAGVAETYFQLLATREQLTVARGNLAVAERVLKVVDARHRHGVASALDLSQQTRTVLVQRSALLPLEVQARQTASALALLLGRVPQGFDVAGEAWGQLAVPQIAAGLPSELLARRPDLAAAEATLAAADADVAAARAALLPSISLSTSGGVASAALASLANPTSGATIGLALAQTLFDGGSRQAAVDLAASQRRSLVEAYAGAARTAFKEVDDALGNAERSTRQEVAQAEVIAESQRSLRLAELRYREGAADLLAVLDAQSTLFSAQDTRVLLQQARLQAALDLFKALGGGWQAPAHPPIAAVPR